MVLEKYLFRVFYHGRDFNGFQRQLNGNTVENYIEMALIRSDLITSFAENSYQSVSRTDTGVSAISNNFAIFCKKKPDLARINANFPKNKSIKIWGFVPIPEDLNVRQPEFKIYAYHLSENEFTDIIDVERLFQFKGVHNFSTFIKKDGAGKENSESIIKDISIAKKASGYKIIITGNKFGREQIRRMIGYIMDTEFVNHDLQKVLITQQNISIRPAIPDPLLLVSIHYKNNLNWTGKFNVSDLKDGSTHFKPKYDLFSAFENQFI